MVELLDSLAVIFMQCQHYPGCGDIRVLMTLYSLNCHNKFPEKNNLIGSLLSEYVYGCSGIWNVLVEVKVIEASGDLNNGD